jgi:hypothetical protein
MEFIGTVTDTEPLAIFHGMGICRFHLECQNANKVNRRLERFVEALWAERFDDRGLWIDL